MLADYKGLSEIMYWLIYFHSFNVDVEQGESRFEGVDPAAVLLILAGVTA